MADFLTSDSSQNHIVLWNRIINDTSHENAASLIQQKIAWGMPQDIEELKWRGPEIFPLYANKNSLHSIRHNPHEQNRTIHFKFICEIFPIMGKIILKSMDIPNANIEVDPTMSFYSR